MMSERQTYTIMREDDIEIDYPAEELWNADPDCKHRIICALGGGVKCTKCPGWYCL